jgi:glutaredoxin-related protein
MIAAVSPEFRKAVDDFIQKNKVLVFMKGNRDFPQCGFSNAVVEVCTFDYLVYFQSDLRTCLMSIHKRQWGI